VRGEIRDEKIAEEKDDKTCNNDKAKRTHGTPPLNSLELVTVMPLPVSWEGFFPEFYLLSNPGLTPDRGKTVKTPGYRNNYSRESLKFSLYLKHHV